MKRINSVTSERDKLQEDKNRLQAELTQEVDKVRRKEVYLKYGGTAVFGVWYLAVFTGQHGLTLLR